MKKKVLVLLFGLFVFTIAGITKVKADATFNNSQVVCVPSELEIGQKSKCYVIAKIADGNIFGVYTRAVTSQLSVKGVGSSQSISVNRLTDGVKSASGMYTCSNITSAPNGYTADPGCVQFESPFTASATTHPAAIVPNNLSTDLNTGSWTGYSEVGYYEVELADTATATNCGTLCVEINYAVAYKAQTTATASNPNPDIYNSTADTQTGSFPKGYACAEIKPIIKGKTTEQPNSGNFASYAVLIAGACIAIAAIAIATKYNKIYKV